MTQFSTFQLDHKNQGASLGDLHTFLQDNRASHVEIDARNVKMLTGQQIELLLCGYAQWQAAEKKFEVAVADEAVVARMTDLGVPSQLFLKEDE